MVPVMSEPNATTDWHRREEVLRILERQCPFGILETDANGVILNVNDELLHLFHLGHSDLERINIEDLSDRFLPECLESVKFHFSQMVSGISGEFQASIVTSDNERKYFQIAYYPIYLNSVFFGSVGVVYDITSKRRVLSELYQLKGEMVDG